MGIARRQPTDTEAVLLGLSRQTRVVASWQGHTVRTRWVDGQPGDRKCAHTPRGDYMCFCDDLADCLRERAVRRLCNLAGCDQMHKDSGFPGYYRRADRDGSGIYTYGPIDRLDVEAETRWEPV